MQTHLAAGNIIFPNGTFFAELLAFIVVLVVLWRWVLPPVRKAMTDRQALIRSQLEEGRVASERLKEAEAEYKKALNEARTTAAAIRDEARADAGAIREEILAKAAEDRDRLVAAGREQLATERQALVRELRSELGSLAVELSSRIIGESLVDEARQRGTVQRFLTELENEAGDAPAGAGGRR